MMDKCSMVVQSAPVRITRNGRRYFSKAYKDAVVANHPHQGVLAHVVFHRRRQRRLRARQSSLMPSPLRYKKRRYALAS